MFLLVVPAGSYVCLKPHQFENFLPRTLLGYSLQIDDLITECPSAMQCHLRKMSDVYMEWTK